MARKKQTLVLWAVLLVVMTAANVSAAAITDNLLAYWQFDETSGTTADNWASTSTDFDGTLMDNAAFVAGKFDNAVSFDGTDDYVDIANQIIPTASPGYSISTWFKVPTLDGTRRMLFETSGDWATSVGQTVFTWVRIEVRTADF